MMDRFAITTQAPAETGTFKIVYLRADDREEIVFGHSDNLQASILETYLKKNQIPFPKVEKELSFSKRTVLIPAPSGDRYAAIAMGRAVAEHDKRKIIFYDYSHDYGLPFNQKHFEGLARILQGWQVSVKSRP